MAQFASASDGSEVSSRVTSSGATPPGAGSSASATLVDRVVGPYRSLTRFLERRALVRAARAVPRSLRHMGATVRHGMGFGEGDAPRYSPGLVLGVAADEAFLAIAMAPSRFPRRADYARVSEELADAEQLFAARGWIADPSTYHRTPPALDGSQVQLSRGWALGLGYEQMAFESGFSPRPDEPGADRWMGFEPNRRAVASIVRHPDHGESRPWIVSVHGFAMGYPSMDFLGLRTARLHHALGFNVASVVLPLHGQRKVTRVSGEPFLSFDLMNTVHGFSQSVWDIRRLVTWIRGQGATSVSVYGVSLGAYVVSLLTGIEDGLASVVAGIPVIDLPALFHEQSPAHVRARSIEHHIIGPSAHSAFAPVSPLGFTPKVPHGGRFIFAGRGDRLANPEHARRLWEHWERPPISWYWGSHIGYLWSRQVATFLEDSLAATGGERLVLPEAG